MELRGHVLVILDDVERPSRARQTVGLGQQLVHRVDGGERGHGGEAGSDHLLVQIGHAADARATWAGPLLLQARDRVEGRATLVQAAVNGMHQAPRRHIRAARVVHAYAVAALEDRRGRLVVLRLERQKRLLSLL